jgi:hypothetical protein
MPPLEKQPMASSGHFISITQASKLTPYSAGYLSLLARRKKLHAFKINRDWLTTPRAVLTYVKKQKIKHEKLLQDLKDAERSMS